MTPRESSARWLDRVLDSFASRTGLISVIGLLLAVCVAAGIYVQSAADRLQQDHAAFRDRDIRIGYVTMSDVQRLVLIAQLALDAGAMTAPLARDFGAVADILQGRTEDFRRVMSERKQMASGLAAIRHLDRIVRLANDAIAAGFPDDRALAGALLDAAAGARRTLILYLDDMRRQAHRAQESQALAIQRQMRLMLANLIVLALISMVALVLLRREVMGRRDRDRAERRVKFLAFFDTLTELPNRAQFQDRLRDMLATNEPLVLLYIDLDDFKMINDTYGHLAGDAALRHVGGVLARIARLYCGFAARLGGDEFALVAPGDGADLQCALCDRILADAAMPLAVDGELLTIGLSIGTAASAGVGGGRGGAVTVDMLSRITDFALYAAKAEGRGCYRLHDSALEQRLEERRAMVEELPEAIRSGQLEAYLQPKVNLRDGQAFGFEALVRWTRGDHLVPPGQFIHIAEESGLVIEIDNCILRRATKLIAEWNAAHGTGFSVSVNLSALHFSSLRIVEWVQDALWEAQLPPELLTLEITETMVMRDWTQARKVVGRLRALGVRIAIDDFGTGFSSLAYLRTIRADELKIDRSLLHELDSSEQARLLLGSVLDIARNLELEVIVEGIETQDHALILRDMGAGRGQGYFYGRPAPPGTALAEATRAQHAADGTVAS